MKYKAVIFDLFGTLVNNFRRQEYDQVNTEIAKVLTIPFSEFWQLVAETGHDYYLGRYDSFEDNLQDICYRWGVEADTVKIVQAAKHHYKFMADIIVPEQEVLDALHVLKARGLQLGLISNCGAAVPFLWEQSPLAQFIDIAVFSCEHHVMKPSIDIYHIASHRLQVQPQKCIYIGDGSYEELTTATAAGMTPILKRTDLDDVYDKNRPEVESWGGLVVDEIRELLDIVCELEV